MWLTSTQWLPEVCQPQTVNRWSVHVLKCCRKKERVNWLRCCLNECCPWCFILRTFPKFARENSVSHKRAQSCTRLNLSDTDTHAIYILSTVDVHTHTQHRAYTFDIHPDATEMEKRHCRHNTRHAWPDTAYKLQNAYAGFKFRESSWQSRYLHASCYTKELALNVYSVCVALSKWHIWTARYS